MNKNMLVLCAPVIHYTIPINNTLHSVRLCREDPPSKSPRFLLPEEP